MRPPFRRGLRLFRGRRELTLLRCRHVSIVTPTVASGPCASETDTGLRHASGGAVATYRVLAGISYPPNKRAEVGDVVDDLPSRSISWLVAAGCIEQVDSPKPKGKKAEPVPPAEETVFFEEATPTYFASEEDED